MHLLPLTVVANMRRLQSDLYVCSASRCLAKWLRRVNAFSFYLDQLYLLSSITVFFMISRALFVLAVTPDFYYSSWIIAPTCVVIEQQLTIRCWSVPSWAP